MERHEAECGYRDVPCIVASCSAYVKFKDYREHIFERHSMTKRPVWVFNRRQRRNTPRLSLCHSCSNVRNSNVQTESLILAETKIKTIKWTCGRSN